MKCCWSYVPFDPGNPDDKYENCEEEANDFYNCNFESGPVCEKHKCRCLRKFSYGSLSLESAEGQAIGKLLSKLSEALAACDGNMGRGNIYRLVAPIIKQAFIEGKVLGEPKEN